MKEKVRKGEKRREKCEKNGKNERKHCCEVSFQDEYPKIVFSAFFQFLWDSQSFIYAIDETITSKKVQVVYGFSGRKKKKRKKEKTIPKDKDMKRVRRWNETFFHSCHQPFLREWEDDVRRRKKSWINQILGWVWDWITKRETSRKETERRKK